MTLRLLACLFQHTAARRRLELKGVWYRAAILFQHTAARRRLVGWLIALLANWNVSTHSRPKAAGVGGYTGAGGVHVSTHSRPKAAGTFDWQ